MGLVCPVCGSKNVRYNSKTGESFCGSCGYVIDITYETKEWRVTDSSELETKPRAFKWSRFSSTTMKFEDLSYEDTIFWRKVIRNTSSVLKDEAQEIKTRLRDLWVTVEVPAKNLFNEDEILEELTLLILKRRKDNRIKRIQLFRTYMGSVEFPSPVPRSLISPAVLYAFLYYKYVTTREYIPFQVFYWKYIVGSKELASKKEFLEYYKDVLLYIYQWLFPERILDTYMFKQASYLLVSKGYLEKWEPFALFWAYTLNNLLYEILNRYDAHTLVAYILLRDGEDVAKEAGDFLNEYLFLPSNFFSNVRRIAKDPKFRIYLPRVLKSTNTPPLYKIFIDKLKERIKF